MCPQRYVNSIAVGNLARLRVVEDGSSSLVSALPSRGDVHAEIGEESFIMASLVRLSIEGQQRGNCERGFELLVCLFVGLLNAGR